MQANVEMTGDRGEARPKGADARGRPCRLPCYAWNVGSSPADDTDELAWMVIVLMRLFTPFEGVALLEIGGVCLAAVISSLRSFNSLAHRRNQSTSDDVHQQRSGLKQRPVKSQRTQGKGECHKAARKASRGNCDHSLDML
jgi:hypothetical protein